MWVLAVASLVTLGQRLHTRADVARSDGAAAKPDSAGERHRDVGATATPERSGIERDGTARGPRSGTSLGGHVTDWGYAAGWRLVRAMPELVARNAFDAGAHYAARGGGPEQLRKNLARVLGVTPAQRAGRADSCFACLLRPILAGGIPVADDGPAEARRAGSTT